MASSPAPLTRFVTAQNAVWPRPLDELRAGAKRSHWMWFVFPQIAGLGRSETARFYAIANADEARAFLRHPVLGERLVAATEAALGVDPAIDAVTLLGAVDALKLASSLTLFDAVALGPAPFDAALARFFAGRRDGETLRRL